jgi:drug/metabolite transporter (DMT)-like permease
MVKALTRTDDAKVIVFNMALMQLPLGLIPALFHWVTPGWTDLPWLGLMGVTGLSAHYAMARALALAELTVVLPMDFLRLPGIALVGLLAYGEALSASTLVGAGLIFGGNYWSVWRERRHRVARNPP